MPTRGGWQRACTLQTFTVSSALAEAIAPIGAKRHCENRGGMPAERLYRFPSVYRPQLDGFIGAGRRVRRRWDKGLP